MAGMNPEFEGRLNAFVAASNGRITIGSGYRTPEQQQALWEEAVRKYGSEAEARRWVAPPGSSNHNRGVAADLQGDLQLAHQLAAAYGLSFPMPWEPWHIELAGAREGADPAAYTSPGPGGVNPVYETIWPDEAFALTVRALTAPEGGLATISAAAEADAMAQQVPVEVPGGEAGLTATGQPIVPGPIGPTANEGPGGTGQGSDDVWAALANIRQHESGGNYTIQEAGGSDHWGAYQFSQSTWDMAVKMANLPQYVGVNPAKAPPAIQDAAAYALYTSSPTAPYQHWYRWWQ